MPDRGELDSLPRGRHGLPRELVTENQRARLIRGMIETVAANGYGETTIADITGAAKISRRTYYENFANKEACFSAAYEASFDYLRERALAAAGAATGWPEQVRAGLDTLLGDLAEHPDLATFFLISPTSVDDAIAARHHLAMRELVSALTEGAPEISVPGEASEPRTEALAGGLSSLIVHKVNAGETESLPELLPAVLELLLRPFLGNEGAVLAAQARG